MERKILFARGNLYTGYPWGVWAEGQFGSGELHGPFNSENTAHNYADALATEDTAHEYARISVVRIETPQVGATITRERPNEDGFTIYGERYVTFDPKLGYRVHHGSWSVAISAAQAAAEERRGTKLRSPYA